MKSLLLKDIYLITKRGVLIPLFALFFAVFASLQANFLYYVMTTMMLMMLSLTTMAYDQSDGFDAFIMAMPIAKKDIVLEKYLLGAIALFLSLVFVIIFTLIIGTQKEVLLSYISLQSAFGLIFMAINYPLIYKFGFEKSRVWYILISMVLASSMGVALNLGLLVLQKLRVMLLPIVALILVFISYQISLNIVKKREIAEN